MMNHRIRKTAPIVIALSGLLLGGCTIGYARTTTSAEEATALPSGPPCPTDGEEMETAKLYIEHNATDSDTGVHGLFGGAAWSELCIWDPNGELILVVDPVGSLGDLRISDLFFESREPPNDEYSIDDLMRDFPEGGYVVSGTDFEGTQRLATARFTHQVPTEPVVVAPVLADEEEAATTTVVSASDFLVRWDPVLENLDGSTATIAGYQVIVTKVDHDDPHGLSRPVYDVHVGPHAKSFSVPENFFESGAVYELEVLALDESGNQTITVGFFVIE